MGQGQGGGMDGITRSLMWLLASYVTLGKATLLPFPFSCKTGTILSDPQDPPSLRVCKTMNQ